jgi:hypothetical protein
MATLADADFVYIQNWVRHQPAVRADLYGWSLSRSLWRAAFQALEDYTVSGFATRPATSIKAAIEAVTGPATASQAQSMYAAYVAWKLHNFLAGG